MYQINKLVSLFLLVCATVILIPLHMKVLGWLFFLFGLFFLLFCKSNVRKDLILIYIALAFLGITPITTDISPAHIMQMSVPLLLAVFIPYFISRFIYKDHVILFQFHHGRSWYTSEILYLVLTGIVAYLFFPFMLHSSGSYVNWTVDAGVGNLGRLFFGTNALGIWDELFFVSTVLGLLRRHFIFPIANFVQSILFTSFLYELGFRGWSFGIIFIFALTQGYIFKRTESLFYLITIHLTFDLILYFALIYAHHPNWMPIFPFS